MNKGWVGRSAGRHQFKYMAMHINIYLYLDLSYCRPVDLAADRGTNMDLNIYYKVLELDMCL